MKAKIKLHLPNRQIWMIAGLCTSLVAVMILLPLTFISSSKTKAGISRIQALEKEKEELRGNVTTAKTELHDFKNQDQFKRNEDLQAELTNIKKTYARSVQVYEDLLDLKAKTDKTEGLDKQYALALKNLADTNYSSASSVLDSLNTDIKKENDKLTSATAIPQNVPVKTDPPTAGYNRQQVNVDGTSYLVNIVVGDLSNTKIIVDTASSGDCTDNCPVLPLAEYISRNGAVAGINGSYFCPSTYPTCAGKTNSFDLLVMNKNKNYFNSGNNVYSNNPAVIFGGSYVRFVSAAREWGRDTGIDSMLSNYPLLVFNKQNMFGGNDDAKMSAKGARGFVANRGNTVYIGVIQSATVAEAAKVLTTMGMDNAMNLDSGGSTALWAGGYKAGPGRNIPNAILFIRK